MDQLRLLVMGGKAALQKYENDKWAHVYIQRCQTIRSGVYHLHNAASPSPDGVYVGPVLSKHGGYFFQEVEKQIIRHKEKVFAGLKVDAGDVVSVDYSQPRPAVTKQSVAPTTNRRITHTL